MVKEFLGISGVVGSPVNEHPKRAIQGLECTKNEVSGTRFWNLIRELCSSPEVFFKNCFVHNYCPLCFMAASGKNITPPMLRTLERRHLEEICNKSLVEVMSLLGVEFVVGVGKYAEERARAALTTVRPSKQAPISIGRTSSSHEPNTSSSQYAALGLGLKGGNSIPSTQSVIFSSQERNDDRILMSCGVDEQCATGRTASEPTPHPPPPNSCCQGNVKVYGLMHPSPINPAANKGWNQLATAKFSELGLLDMIKGGE